MKILKTPWKDDFLELAYQAKKFIRITSPFVKNDICSELIKVKNDSTRIDLITSFKLLHIYTGSLDISALENIITSNGIVKNYPQLHSKIYLFDDEKAIITSGNLTNGGLINNFEYGLFIDEKSVVDKIVEDFELLSNNEKTGVVKIADLERVKSIIEKIPKPNVPNLPEYNIEINDENLDVLSTPLEPILSSLSGWKLEVFICAHDIPQQIFSLNDINKYANHLKKIYPQNEHITHKIRQQLQYLRDLGLIEFLGNGIYKKLWR